MCGMDPSGKLELDKKNKAGYEINHNQPFSYFICPILVAKALIFFSK